MTTDATETHGAGNRKRKSTLARRKPRRKFATEITIDTFAGGGGASLASERATGRPVAIAVNHDPVAIAMHMANHPDTEHLTEDVFHVNLAKVVGRRRVGHYHASPDCTFFSQARGSMPLRDGDRKVRALAWSVVKHVRKLLPRVVTLENVREFARWGPVVPQWKCRACAWKGTEGQIRLGRPRLGRPRCARCNSLRVHVVEKTYTPDPFRKGVTFDKFVEQFRLLGYSVDWKDLVACDYGAPTKRKRLFLVARLDGKPVVWPEPTHFSAKAIAAGKAPATAKRWRSAAECVDWSIPCPSIFDRKKPLVEKTMWRIAQGLKRYVLDEPNPFLVVCNHGNYEFRGGSIGEPFPTVAASRDAHGVVTPILADMQHGNRGRGPDEPLGAVTGQTNRFNVVNPVLVGLGGPGYGEREGQQARVNSAEEPAGTAVNTPKQAVLAAFLAKHFGGVVGAPADEPLPTTLTSGAQTQIVAPYLVHLNHGEKQWASPGEPLRTITAHGQHAALVYAFLLRYFGTAIGQHCTEPFFTLTGKDRFGLVTVLVDGGLYAIVDIGMRMLTARELARAQGFPDSYVLTGSKTSQVARIGNSVPPAPLEALIRANYKPKRYLAR